MKNLADAIESFIIGELLREHEDTVLVQRNELAERLSCAPSQISYVLSTRFTPERGFMVESRRGSGGFVRIVRMQPAANTQAAYSIAAGAAFAAAEDDYSKGRRFTAVYAADYRRR